MKDLRKIVSTETFFLLVSSGGFIHILLSGK